MSEKAKKACELCKEQSATVLCAECCKCYCERCNKTLHSILKGHKTESIPEGVVVDAMCPLHKDIPLEMFCVDEVKLCCSTCTGRTKDIHKGHNVVDLSDVSQDNEVFSASEVRKRFADVLKCDDELDRKIEETIESIRKEGNEAIEKVKQTFIEAHEKLTEEEGKIMGELERVCNESEEVLQKNLGTLREVREYSKILNEADTKLQGKETSRLMELNLVCSMEEQRRTMEELHGMMMTDLKIGWDSEERKLSFTRTLFNGAPIPNNISFSSVSSRGMKISWDCDLSRMSEEDQRKVKYVVEAKKGTEEERGWKEVYSGAENKCSVSGLDKDTEYNVRVKCVIEELHGGWSDVAKEKTQNVPEFSEGAWKKCPEDANEGRKYSVDSNPRIATKTSGGNCCTIIGNAPLPLCKVTSWRVKVLRSRDNDGDRIYIGVAPFDINQNTDENMTTCGWYFYCYTSALVSGPPHSYSSKDYGPRNGTGKNVRTGDTVGVVMDTTKGDLSYVFDGSNYGVAYERIPIDKPLVPCVLLCYGQNDSVELII